MLCKHQILLSFLSFFPNLKRGISEAWQKVICRSRSVHNGKKGVPKAKQRKVKFIKFSCSYQTKLSNQVIIQLIKIKSKHNYYFKYLRGENMTKRWKLLVSCQISSLPEQSWSSIHWNQNSNLPVQCILPCTKGGTLLQRSFYAVQIEPVRKEKVVNYHNIALLSLVVWYDLTLSSPIKPQYSKEANWRPICNPA